MRFRLLRAVTVVLGMVMAAAIAPASALAAPPSNDAFADPITIPSGDLPFDDGILAFDEATRETGEPVACGYGAFGTAWYRIVPVATAYLHAAVNVDDRGYPVVVAVYTGTSLGDLQLVDCGENPGEARVTWRAMKGVQYFLQVNTFVSKVFLDVRKVKAPSNDDFAAARAVTGLPLVHVTDLVNATRQAGEPDPTTQPAESRCVDDYRGRTIRTIWYRYRPSRTGYVRVDTLLTGAETWVSVHLGTTLGGLTPIACNDDISEVGTEDQSSVTWKAVAGRTYHIQVGGRPSHAELAVRFRKATPPPNDDLVAAAVMPQSGTVRTVDTRTATTESWETFPEGLTNPGASVWYRFSPAVSGTYHLDTQGSADVSVIVAVYRGSSPATLVFVDEASNPWYEPLAFPVTAGEQYRIQVFGRGHDAGRIHLHLKPAP